MPSTPRTFKPGAWTLHLAVVTTAACAEGPEGLARTPDGDGPVVRWEIDQEPLPELPLPNDFATRPDADSPTGQRLNASILAPTTFEKALREKLDSLSGWGTSQPFSISFDAALDIDSLLAGHRDWQAGDGSDYDFTNDVVYLIDVTPGSPTYQQAIPLDFGDGNFPETLRRADLFFEADPRTTTTVLLSETFDEDKDGDGRLDPGEDLDMDGRLDAPNVHEMLDGAPGIDPYGDVMSFYDKQSNTLSGRPLIPMLPKTTYALVVTDRLLGENGDPVRSPFEYVNHTDQTEELERALAPLAGWGVERENIAFAWTFTTQAIHDDMVAIRDGLYGHGSMSWLAEDFPAEISELHFMREENDHNGEPVENRYALPGDVLAQLVAPLASMVFNAKDTAVMTATHAYLGYHVSGSFETPYFLDMEGEDPSHNGTWPTDLQDPSLRQRVGRRTVYFWCALPRWQHKIDGIEGVDSREEAIATPAPVVVYGHGYSNNRLEHLGGFTSNYAKFGIAGCAIDAVDHGIQVDEELAAILPVYFGAMALGPLADLFYLGRAPDLDGDGVVDSGDTWFGVDGFRTRDSFRQSVLDYMMLIRLLRSFDGEQTMAFDVDGDGENEIAGDFNADGYVDLGGWDNDYFATGTSLGGFVSSMLSAVEPSIVAAAPVSGGAGGTSLVLKSEQAGVFESFGLQAMGPAWIGVRVPEPAEGEAPQECAGGVHVYQLFPNGNDAERRTAGCLELDQVQEGDVVMATNLETHESRCARVISAGDIPAEVLELPGLAPENMKSVGNYWSSLTGSFRVALPADRLDRVKIEVLAGSRDREVVEVETLGLSCTKNDHSEVRATVDRWQRDGSYWGFEYASGDPLVSLEHGLGLKRANPLMRRFVGIAGMSVEAGDPVNYAPYYSKYPLVFHENGEAFTKPPVNVLNVVTIGDPAVPVSSGIQIARAAGFFDLYGVNPTYGVTTNRVFADNYVTEGIPWLDRYPGYEGQLLDVDNFAQSTNTVEDKEGIRDGFDAPRLNPPLRLAVPTPNGDGVSGMSMPLIEAEGAHAFIVGSNSQFEAFDIGMFMSNQLAVYFWSRGRTIADDPCMEEVAGCDFLPTPLLAGDRECTTDDQCQSDECVYADPDDPSGECSFPEI